MNNERRLQLNRQRLNDPNLKPELSQKVKQLISLAESEGYYLLVTAGFRSNVEQNRLYAIGRTRPGKIVTNAKGGQSDHNFGKAVDLAFLVDEKVVWDYSLYAKIGKWAKEVKLRWGGNWKRFKDRPHVYL